MVTSPQTGHRVVQRGVGRSGAEAHGLRVKGGGSAFGPSEGTGLPRPRPTTEDEGLGWPRLAQPLGHAEGSREEAGQERPWRCQVSAGHQPGAGRPAGWRLLHAFQTKKEGETKIKQSKNPVTKQQTPQNKPADPNLNTQEDFAGLGCPSAYMPLSHTF